MRARLGSEASRSRIAPAAPAGSPAMSTCRNASGSGSSPRAPAGVLLATNAKLPPPLQRLRPGALPTAGAALPLRIMFPPNGARLELAGAGGKPDLHQMIQAKLYTKDNVDECIALHKSIGDIN